ncbi:hypothetical protein DND62_26415 [Pseudomonas syringae pv. pisi]|nr:hypothetical protein DND62_26415 [Pseudomonas syringae pv. pisi]PYD24478.1 hypothetical protein DND67_28590 [Pseudomonas syringae pv. pisi]
MDNPYSSLFEKKFDLPTQRRRFVEQEVDGKFPSIGYAYLTSLVDENYFNTIFTTNFDDLINEAFYLFSNSRPIVCAHDSSIHSISITSKRPKVVKLHGDYLFDDIKSTLRETESLEQNTKEKFVEFCKEYGLIVVGYSGSDRSIMDVLEFLARQENYLKNGIYWCFRNTDEICHTLKNLIWRDKVYPVIVDGFDELFAEIHAQTVQGELKLNSGDKKSKLQKTLKNIISDNFALSNNPIIAREINAIKSDDDSKDISEFVKQMNSASASSRLGMRDVRNLMEIDSLIESSELAKAEELCSLYYESIEKAEGKKIYIEKYIDIYERLGNDHKVGYWCDKLIDIDPNNIEYQLKKARSFATLSERIDYLVHVCSAHQFSTALLNSLSTARLRCMQEGMQNNITIHFDETVKNLDKSLSIDPSLDNLAWSIKMDALIFKYNKLYDSEEKKAHAVIIAEHVKSARARHSEHMQALEIAKDQLRVVPEESHITPLLDYMFQLWKSSSIAKRRKINDVISEIFNHAYDVDNNSDLVKRLKYFVEEHLKADDSSPLICLARARYWLTFGNNVKLADEEIDALLKRKRMAEHIDNILKLPIEFSDDRLALMQGKLENERHLLLKSYYFETLSEIRSFRGDYYAADQYIESAYKEGLSFGTYFIVKTYGLLMTEQYPQILNLSDRYKSELEMDKSEGAIINIQLAAKKIGSNKYSEVVLRNLSAQSVAEDVKICAFSMLNQPLVAKRLIEQSLKKDPGLLYRYKRWPALTSECMPNLTNDTVAAHN